MSPDPAGELAALLPRLTRDSRIHYLDNLRSSLIALVIFHHAALPFGGIGFWSYVSPYHPADSKSISSGLLGLFVALNQSFFMGTLFFLAGHFSALAAERKTPKAFCVDKLKRLGIPAVAYTLLVHPIVLVLVESASHAPIPPALRGYFLNLNGVRGPAWFITVLLVFDLVYITIRACLPSFSFLVPTSPSHYRASAAIGIATVIVCSFFIRMWYPIGRTLEPFNLQVAYASQYVFAYIAGTSLSKIQQFLLVSHPTRALIVAHVLATLSISVFATIAKSTPFGVRLSLGGANPFAFFFAAWNELCFYFIGTGWYSLFHGSEWTTKRWRNTARYSYAAFLIHPLVVVALQIAVDKIAGAALNGIVKTLWVGTFGVCLSWAAGWFFVRVPGVGKIV